MASDFVPIKKDIDTHTKEKERDVTIEDNHNELFH